jgi:hypothetical protein
VSSGEKADTTLEVSLESCLGGLGRGSGLRDRVLGKLGREEGTTGVTASSSQFTCLVPRIWRPLEAQSCLLKAVAAEVCVQGQPVTAGVCSCGKNSDVPERECTVAVAKLPQQTSLQGKPCECRPIPTLRSLLI